MNQRIGRIIAGPKLSTGYIFYRLRSELKKIEDLTAATTVKHLSHSDVESIVIPLPSLPEQQAIASILSDMDSEIAQLERELGKLRALKQGMMQELLTGRVRLV